ncbi:4-coumarate--CoA ligase-like [Thalictrum thalictroides]|uniref:4-coumarate--CoA ligase n=1 Tax=Thalictrum thalictroides TaxID=46969 RepID=A0A7J6VXN2_THATH|nr:4-coumarate--CoA ligase-like [Thalictrum thalictroides]
MSESKSNSVSDWFCSKTGIYNSKYKSIQLPQNPFLDVVSFIFSHKHNGVSALIDSTSGFSLSYSNLHQMVYSLGSGLHEFGISKKDVVLILLPNTIFFPVVFLGVLSSGAIASTMNPLSSVIELKKQIVECNVNLVFTESDNVDKIESLNIGVRVIKVPQVSNLGEFKSESPQFDSFRKLVSNSPGSASRPVINQQDTAAILYSSGTSGVSKGVLLSHGNLIAVVELFVRFEALQYDTRFPVLENVYLASIPMFHIYGLSLFGMGLLSLGTSIVVMRKFNADEMVRAIDRYGVTHLPAVPPILMALTRAKAHPRRNLGSLKQVSSGAAPLSRKTIEDFLQSFPHVDFIQGYGMTESTAVGTRGLNTENFIKYNSVGLLAPNTQAKVVNWNSGSCLPPGNSGELWLRGPGIMKGYLNDADATTSAVDNDGWLHTGDIVSFDQDGYLYILDRLKEIIKYKGFQIAPADLEAALISHPEILDVAVTGYADAEAGEVPMAFVVKKPGTSLSQEDVINFVAGMVAPYKKVRKIVFTHSIPKSAAGKILRRQLKNSLVSRI